MIKASTLRSNEIKKKALSTEIKGITGMLMDNISTAHKQGLHACSVSVPITFSIPNMSNSDAQRVIYSTIIADLIDNEYIPQIKMTKKSVIFTITWITDEEKREARLQDALIAKYSTDITDTVL